MNAEFIGGLIAIWVGLLLIAASIASQILWVWMLSDCARREGSEGNTKALWILVIVFTNWIGALIYLLVRRPQRIQERGE